MPPQSALEVNLVSPVLAGCCPRRPLPTEILANIRLPMVPGPVGDPLQSLAKCGRSTPH